MAFDLRKQRMKLWQRHLEGTVVPVHVSSGARRNLLRWEPDGLLRAWLTQSPEKGKATQALLEIVAEALGIRKSLLELLSDHHSAQKRLLTPPRSGTTPTNHLEVIQTGVHGTLSS